MFRIKNECGLIIFMYSYPLSYDKQLTIHCHIYSRLKKKKLDVPDAFQIHQYDFVCRFTEDRGERWLPLGHLPQSSLVNRKDSIIFLSSHLESGIGEFSECVGTDSNTFTCNE